MYNEFFGFKKKPFSLVSEPEFLYFSPIHKKAWTVLQYGLIVQAGFTVITGEIGAGKTTLIRKALTTLDDKCEVGLITNTHSAFGDLLTWVLAAFRINSKAQDKAGRYQSLMEFLTRQHQRRRRVILIVDEAQNMDLQTLEELRLLSNINISQDVMIQLVLVGQPELVTKLNSPELVQFAQRISVEYHIKALDFEQTLQYINHRLVVAGCRKEIFEKLAYAAIYYYSGGIPRLINNICDLSLVFAFAEGQHYVDLTTVQEVIKEKKTGGFAAFKTGADPEADNFRMQVLAKSGVDIGIS